MVGAIRARVTVKVRVKEMGTEMDQVKARDPGKGEEKVVEECRREEEVAVREQERARLN